MVLGQRGRDYLGARGGGELDEEAANAAHGADHEHGLTLAGRQRFECCERGERRQGDGSGLREIEATRLRRHVAVVRDGDQLGPASVVDLGICVPDEAEDLVADAEAADIGADRLHDAGEVSAERHRKPVLGHLLQCSHGDEGVHRVDGRRVHANEQTVLGRAWLRKIVAQARLRIEPVEGEGAHRAVPRLARRHNVWLRRSSMTAKNPAHPCPARSYCSAVMCPRCSRCISVRPSPRSSSTTVTSS